MRLSRSLACQALAVIALQSAHAADRAPPARLPDAFDWRGVYVGGHVGYGAGQANVTAFDPAAVSGSNRFGGLTGGVQAGYNHMLSSGLLLGVEADLTFQNYYESNPVVALVQTPSGGELTEQLDYVGTVRGRIGRTFGSWMIYGTGGFAFAGERVLNAPAVGDDEKALQWRRGWVAGVGAEYAFAPAWTARIEYLRYGLSATDTSLASGMRLMSAMDFQTVRLGLNYKMGARGSTAAGVDEKPLGDDRWELHAQTTYIQQGYPAFRAPYSGVNSLTPWPQTRNTWSNSAFVGLRLWDGGEVYYNPELAQGFGLHDTTGLAGYPNGEAQKSNFPYPRYNTARLFLRQTFGFGGEQETLESGPNQLSAKVDVSRLTVQAGKFGVLDVFDNNAYAKDPRKDFMNWSIWAPGAFDYSADKVGLTYGVTAELNQKNWALRAGYFLMDATSNANNFDPLVFRRGSYVLELEQRYRLFSRPGKLRLLGFLNSAFSGGYRETLDNPALNLDIAQTRRGRIKYGYAVNVEQSVTDDIGLFGRWSWNDGRNETMAFTEIDASLSFGTSIKGASWGRPDDTVGLGAAINGLSRDHRDFIAAGGVGFQIGDGRLNYSTERILETYYAIGLMRGTSLTFNYQYAVNPAYNTDRGPVSIFSTRLHAEF